MKVLIPGVSGPIGRLVAQKLLLQGHSIVGIDRRPWPSAPPGVEMHNVDLRKRAAEEVFRKSRPDAVVHMATVTHLVERTEERYRINLGGTRAVFEYSCNYGVKQTIFVGRHTYYGAAADSPLYHREEDPPMAVSTFPELADLVAADLYACTELWRYPSLTTTVLRICYTLGSTGQGTLAAFLRGPRVPAIFGFDPLFQFIHEEDVALAICTALEHQLSGVYNVAGPPPVPLSVLAEETGRRLLYIPEFSFGLLLGRFGLPHLPKGAISHIKYPVVVDDRRFRERTGFKHQVSEAEVMRQYRMAFPLHQ